MKRRQQSVAAPKPFDFHALSLLRLAGCLCDRWAVAILLSFLVALAVNAAFFAIAATRKTGVVTSFDPALLEAEASALTTGAWFAATGA